MGIFKNLWSMIFGVSQNTNNEIETVKEPILDVVHNKEIGASETSKDLATEYLELQEEQTCAFVEPINDVCQLQPNTINHGVFGLEPAFGNEEFNTVIKDKVVKEKKVIGQKTLTEIKDYLLKYGSIDVLTCEQKFKIKSLRNFIWHLRKDGLNIKTDNIVLHNELGEEVRVTNYILIRKQENGAN
jgi:hypothetical protein